MVLVATNPCEPVGFAGQHAQSDRAAPVLHDQGDLPQVQTPVIRLWIQSMWRANV